MSNQDQHRGSENEAVSPGSVIMDPDAYFKAMVPPDTAPGVWRWDDIQGLPLLAQARALFWEEPIGHDNVQHIVREGAGSWSAQEERETVESAPNIVRGHQD